MNPILFKEKQRFSQKIFRGILLLVTGLFIYAFVQQVVLHHPFGNKPMSDKGIFYALVFLAIFNLLFFSMQLVTTIIEDAIIIRFYPFHIFPKRFEWSQLSEVIVREYNPLKEFGGWGLRGFGNKKAMSVSGNWLIEIVFLNNQSLLIGTKCPKEVEAALAKTKFVKKDV